jgi:hypothetical protein
MIGVRDAVERAIAHLREMQELAGEQVSGLEVEEVEEVEKSSDDRQWSITLSYLRKPSSLSQMIGGSSLPKERVYKDFNVDAETGEVRSMRIRQIHAT